LRSLSFRRNPHLKNIPCEFYTLTKLNWLGFDETVENVSQSIFTEGTPAVLEELKRQYLEKTPIDE